MEPVRFRSAFEASTLHWVFYVEYSDPDLPRVLLLPKGIAIQNAYLVGKNNL